MGNSTATLLIGVSLSKLFVETKEINGSPKKLIAKLPNKKEVCISNSINENGRWEYDFYLEFDFDGRFYVGVTDIDIDLELYYPKTDNLNLNDVVIGLKLNSINTGDDDLVTKIYDYEIEELHDKARKQLTHLYSYFENINLYLMNTL